jgi:hypothetical protein
MSVWFCPDCHIAYGPASQCSRCGKPGIWQHGLVTASAAHEDQLTLGELAAYHIGLFASTASRIDASPAFLAHALSVLIEQAFERRRQWLPPTQAAYDQAMEEIEAAWPGINDDGTFPD